MNVFTKTAAALAALVALALTPAFADTIHLRSGEEIQDAAIIKVGARDVEYKIGERETIYTAKKSDILIILYADGTKDVFDTKESKAAKKERLKKEREDSGKFSAGKKFATAGLNVVPGLGSIVLMHDKRGAAYQWVFTGAGAVLGTVAHIYESATAEKDEWGESNYDGSGFIGGLAIGWGASFVFGAIRSFTYQKPQPQTETASKYGDLNLAVLPTRHGNGMAYGVMYSKGF